MPIKSESAHYVHEGKLRVYRSRTGGNEWEALTKGLPQKVHRCGIGHGGGTTVRTRAT